MPLSDDDFGVEEEKAGQNLAVLAEALYLTNLLLLPGLAFVLLFGLWLKYGKSAPPLARQHLKQTTYVSLIGGMLTCSTGQVGEIGSVNPFGYRRFILGHLMQDTGGPVPFVLFSPIDNLR